MTTVHQRKLDLTKLKKNPDPQNLAKYRLSRAVARRTIHSTKRDSWRNYVSKLNRHTQCKRSGIWLGNR